MTRRKDQGKDPEVIPELGISRRNLLKRGAIAGGTLLWVAPVIKSLTPPAFAAEPSPEPTPPPQNGDCCCTCRQEDTNATFCRQVSSQSACDQQCQGAGQGWESTPINCSQHCSGSQCVSNNNVTF